jgi:hypothetical protein
MRLLTKLHSDFSSYPRQHSPTVALWVRLRAYSAESTLSFLITEAPANHQLLGYRPSLSIRHIRRMFGG